MANSGGGGAVADASDPSLAAGIHEDEDKDAVYPAIGFVDVQVNGYVGVDFCSTGLTESDFCRAARALLKTGTVAFLPTVITASVEEYAHVLPIIGKCIKKPEFADSILGIHLEGPFISSKPGAVGAHRPKYTRAPDPDFLQQLVEWSQDTVRLVTIAAELPGAAELCRWCSTREKRGVGRNIVVSLGHQLAGSAQMAALAAEGACMLTHLGNGMPNTVNRHHNPLLAGLSVPQLAAGIIADGFHLPEHVLRVMLYCKGVDNLVAVSDMAPICGCAPGAYDCLGTRVVLEENFRVSEFGKDNLAGSGSTLTQCANVLRTTLRVRVVRRRVRACVRALLPFRRATDFRCSLGLPVLSLCFCACSSCADYLFIRAQRQSYGCEFLDM